MQQPKLVAMSNKKSFKQTVEREMAAFEDREKQFLARERKERLTELLGFMPDLENTRAHQ